MKPDNPSRWSQAWLGWGDFDRFWTQQVRWAMRPSGSATMRVTTHTDGDTTRVIVEALDEQGERLEFARFVGRVAGLEDLLSELNLIRDLLTSGQQLSDIQLFSQLKNLNEIKGALQVIDNETARRMVSQVDQLLDSVFSSSKFA